MREDIAKAIDRLANEVVNLRRDTARLHARVSPEWSGREPGYLDSMEFEPRNSLYYGKPKPVTEQEAWALIKAMRDQLRGVDYHMGAVRSHMDDICKDAISREEMKPYLKEK